MQVNELCDVVKGTKGFGLDNVSLDDTITKKWLQWLKNELQYYFSKSQTGDGGRGWRL